MCPSCGWRAGYHPNFPHRVDLPDDFTPDDFGGDDFGAFASPQPERPPSSSPAPASGPLSPAPVLAPVDEPKPVAGRVGASTGDALPGNENARQDDRAVARRLRRLAGELFDLADVLDP